MIHILLSQLTSPKLLPAVLPVLEGVIEDCIGARRQPPPPSQGQITAIDTIGALLPRIVSVLLECLTAPGNASSRHDLIRMLRRLTVEAPRQLLPYLRNVEPLLGIEELADMAAQQQASRVGLSHPDELATFVEQAEQMPAAGRHRALQLLSEGFESRSAKASGGFVDARKGGGGQDD